MYEKVYFEKLIANGEIEKTIKELLIVTKFKNQESLFDNIMLVSARWSRNEEKKQKYIINENDSLIEENRICNALRNYLKDYSEPDQSILSSLEIIQKNDEAQSKKKFINVFISYSTKDKEIATKLKNELEKNGMIVNIDFENLYGGDDIVTFIENSIRDSLIILPMISINSLLSEWVAYEIIQTFYIEKFTYKKIIPVMIDTSIFKKNFVDKAMNEIERKITNIRVRLNKRLEKNRGISDYQDELLRYENLYNNLPKIVQRLKNSLTIDISEKKFEGGFKKLISSIQQINTTSSDNKK